MYGLATSILPSRLLGAQLHTSGDPGPSPETAHPSKFDLHSGIIVMIVQGLLGGFEIQLCVVIWLRRDIYISSHTQAPDVFRSRRINAHLESICKWKSHILETVQRVSQERQQVFVPFSARYRIVCQDDCALSQARKNDFKRWESEGRPDYIMN